MTTQQDFPASLSKRKVMAPPMTISMPEEELYGRKGPEGTVYYHQDGLGSILAITDANGNMLNKYDYAAFGQPEIILETVENSLLFTGEPYDQSELLYLRARYYDPKTGRFVSKDKYKGEIADPSSQNSYAYCGNNPVNYVDPSGNYLAAPALVKSVEFLALAVSAVAAKVLTDVIQENVKSGETNLTRPITIIDAPTISDIPISDTRKNNDPERITLFHYGYEIFLDSYLQGMKAGTYYTTNPLMSGKKATEYLSLPLKSKGFKNPDIVISVSMPKTYYEELQNAGKIIGPRRVEPRKWEGQNNLLGGGNEIIINAPLIQDTNGVLITPFRRNI